MEQSTILIILGVVLALVFLMQQWTQYRSVIKLVAGLVVLVAAITGYFVYRHREEVRQAQELVARRAEFESRISQFAAKYNAVTDWQKTLEGKPGKHYSAELQPLLVRADGRPVLVFAFLRNVSTNSGNTEVYLDESGGLESRFKLQLDCTPDQARSVMSERSAYGFEAVAQIRSVEFVQAGDYSLAKGRCVDLMPVSLSDYFELVVGPELEKQVHHSGE